MQHPRMAFSLLTLIFVVLVGTLALLELVGVEGIVLRVALVFFLFSACLLIGARTRTMDIAAFLRTERRMPVSFDAMAACVNGVAGLLLAFVAAGGGFSDPGFTAIVTGWAAGLFLFAFLVAAPMRRSGANTLPEFFALRFDADTPRLAALVVVIAVSFGLFASQLAIATELLMRLVPVSREVAVWLTAGLLVACALLGGMRSVAWVQAALFVIVAISLLAPTLLTGLTGPSFTQPTASEPLAPALSLAGLTLCMLAGTAAMPHIATRSLAGSTPSAARSAAATTMIVTTILIAIAPMLAHIGPESRADGTILAGMLAGTGLLAASMAVSAGLLITMANVVGNDLYARGTQGGNSNPSRLLGARLALIVIGVTGGLVASVGVNDPVNEMVWSFTLSAAALFAPLLASIWWKRINAAGAVAGMAAGTITAVSLFYRQRSAGFAWDGLDPATIGLVGIAASIIGVIAASLLSRRFSEEDRWRHERLHISAERL